MSIWDLLPWLGGGSVVALIAVAVLAPSVLQVAGNWLSALSPAIRGAAEFLVEVCKSLWAGFLDMTDNGRSILFVGAVALCAYIWGYAHGVDKPPKTVVKTVERQCPTRRSTGRPAPQPVYKDPLTSFFEDIFGPGP